MEDGAVFGEKDLGVVGDDGLAGLIAHGAEEDIVGRGREGVERCSGEEECSGGWKGFFQICENA